MKVTTLDEKSIRDIGHAFGYYDYGEETGMSAAFPGKKPRQTISALMCAGCCGAAFCTPPASRVRAISPISCRRRRWDSRRCGPLPAECCTTPPLKRLLRFGIAIKRGRGFPARPHGQGKEALHLRWACLCAGAISGGRAICARCWSLPLPRATGWACR